MGMATVRVGRLGSPFKETVVDDNATVREVFDQLSITLGQKETVVIKNSMEREDGDAVDLNEIVEDGATYVITVNTENN